MHIYVDCDVPRANDAKCEECVNLYEVSFIPVQQHFLEVLGYDYIYIVHYTGDTGSE